MVITNRKEYLHFNFQNEIEYIWIHINMISFSFLYEFLKNYWNEIGKKKISHGRGRGVWCMLGRAFLCRTGHLFLCRTGLFCVEPCILVSNRAFLSRKSVIIRNRWQTNNQNIVFNISTAPGDYNVCVNVWTLYVMLSFLSFSNCH